MRAALYAAGVIALGMVVASFFVGTRRMSPAACFTVGRVMGGAEQRAFASVADGYQVLAKDRALIESGAPDGCK